MNEKTKCFTAYGHIIDEARDMAKFLSSVFFFFSHVYGECNTVIHATSRYAQHVKYFQAWLEVSPPFIAILICKDLATFTVVLS